jgi:hypothetical protein
MNNTGPEVSGRATSQPPTVSPQRRPASVATAIRAGVTATFSHTSGIDTPELKSQCPISSRDIGTYPRMPHTRIIFCGRAQVAHVAGTSVLLGYLRGESDRMNGTEGRPCNAPGR